ncbi:MAG: hypothetical protein KDC34_12585 [Saprospiraceae bacterium]|nr:hypothetical protein [Saprospiraceae bacterium]
MANRQTDHLFQLIQALSKSEKRNFRLYAYRSGNTGETKFVRLFDIIDRQSEYDETQIYLKEPSIKRAQLSNLKAHLYKQILASLRLLHRNHDQTIQVRENLDYAKVLYNKGLFRQSLRLLERTKNQARQSHNTVLILEIIEFEKHIECHHVTHSLPSRAEELAREASEIHEVANRTAILSNLSLKMYGLFLKAGYIRNEEDFQGVEEYFYSQLPDYKLESLSFFEKLYYYESFVWFHYIIQDFLMCYKYCQKWVDLFEETPNVTQVYPDIYIKGIHNLLATLFNLQHHRKFRETIKKLEAFGEAESARLSASDHANLQAYLFTHKINAHFMEGTFSEGVKALSGLEKSLQELEAMVDINRITLLRYKLACLYFGSGNNKKAIGYLNMIINERLSEVREDIHCFARILNLIAHYELGNDSLVDYQIRSVYRFLIKMDNMQEVQKEIFQFLRNLRRIQRDEIREAFMVLKEKLKILEKDTYLSRPFLYLDIISWLESKIEKLRVEEVIRKKFLSRQANKHFD